MPSGNSYRPGGWKSNDPGVAPLQHGKRKLHHASDHYFSLEKAKKKHLNNKTLRKGKTTWLLYASFSILHHPACQLKNMKVNFQIVPQKDGK